MEPTSDSIEDTLSDMLARESMDSVAETAAHHPAVTDENVIKCRPVTNYDYPQKMFNEFGTDMSLALNYFLTFVYFGPRKREFRVGQLDDKRGYPGLKSGLDERLIDEQAGQELVNKGHDLFKLTERQWTDPQDWSNRSQNLLSFG
ncbi:hypothetical protein ACJA88_015227 [Fusarium oxysporum]